jgi:hypothetical protein
VEAAAEMVIMPREVNLTQVETEAFQAEGVRAHSMEALILRVVRTAEVAVAWLL